MKRLLNNKYLTHPLVFLVIRLITGGIFVLFGLAKALEPQASFYASIRAYNMLPDSIVPFFATCVLIAEIVCGLGVVLGLYARYSAYGLLILLVMFIIAITQAMVRGIYLPDCGCSGSWLKLGDTPVEVLVRDVCMALSIVWYLTADTKQKYALDKLLS